MWQLLLNGPGYLDTPYELPDGETLLGRGEDNHVVLAGTLVSRRHARLVANGDELAVEDAGSRNGTLLNGKPVEGRAPLAPGDRLAIGENRLLVRRAEPGPRPAETVLFRHEPGLSLARLDRARALGALAQGPEVSALVLLYQVSERLASAPSLQRFLEEVADLVLGLARARTVVVKLRQGDGLVPLAVRHRGGALAAGEVPVSRGVVEECVRSRVALCVADVAQDERFSSRESVLHYGFSQVICAPFLRDGQVEGLVYLTRDADDAPLQPLMEAIVTVAHLAGTGIEQQRLRERAAAEEQVRQRLARFLGTGLAAELAGHLDGARMDEREATLLFADISGFTPLTERLPAERVVALLDAFYRRMARVVFAHGGTVDKFIGDAVMAVFGAPRAGGDDAARALRAALAMRAEFEELMASWPDEERCRLKIGLNTGRVLAGIVGGDERLEYTAVGDAVNVAARLVGEAAPGQIVAGASTVAAAGPGFVVAPLGVRQVRGRSGPVEVFELRGVEVVP